MSRERQKTDTRIETQKFPREAWDLFSLETHRLRGQLVENFKILRGFDNFDYHEMFLLSEGVTINNGYKLELKRYNRDLCGNYLTYSIFNRWNAFPSDVVNCNSVEQFKSRLDVILPRRMNVKTHGVFQFPTQSMSILFD